MKKSKSLFTVTFEWNSLIRDIFRNSWAVILAGLIALLGIQIYEKIIYTPTYTSNAVLVVRSKVGSSGAYSNLSASSEMATIFTQVFTQNSMKKLAAENIGEKSFDGEIIAEVNGSTNLLNVSVKSKNPETAFMLLSSVLEVYPQVSGAVFTDAVIDVISAPGMPSHPSNSPLTIYRNQIVLIVMVLQGMLIVLLSLLRETVKEEMGFSDKIDSRLVGVVSHERAHLSFKEKLKGKKRALLINDAYSGLKFAEDYQKIATKLENMKKNKGRRVFAITSVAENEGKSTVASNIAIALAGRGYKVALLDLDVHKSSIHKIFDCREQTVNDFSDVLLGKIFVSDFKFYHHKKSNVYIAFNKKIFKDTTALFSGSSLKNSLNELRKEMDFVIIDTPPVSVTSDAVSAATDVDRTLLVVRTDCVAVKDINDAILTISDAGGKLAGCILNDVYKPFTLFGQMGSDETGSNGYGAGYRSYSKYAHYADVQDTAEEENISD